MNHVAQRLGTPVSKVPSASSLTAPIPYHLLKLPLDISSFPCSPHSLPSPKSHTVSDSKQALHLYGVNTWHVYFETKMYAKLTNSKHNPNLKIPGSFTASFPTWETQFSGLQMKKGLDNIVGPWTLLLKQHLNVWCGNEAKTYGLSFLQSTYGFYENSRAARIKCDLQSRFTRGLVLSPKWSQSFLALIIC